MTMKLLKLHIENFRSLRDVTWEPGDLNVLIGPNAGGKSNLLKAIDLLAAAADGRLRDHVTRQGGIGSIVWNWGFDAIEFSALVRRSKDRNVSSRSGQIAYGLALQRAEKSSDYKVVGETLGPLPKSDKSPPDYAFNRDEHHGAVGSARNGNSFGADELKSDESLFLYARSPRFGGKFVNEFGKYLSGWKPYQSFRTDPDATARWSEISRREPLLAVNGANLVSVLHTLYSDSSAFESDVNDAMFAAFGDEFVKLVFSPDAADQRIQFKVRWKSLENPVPASDLSDGTLRYLYLLAILANPNPPPLIAIDEPEIGLHPRMMRYIAEFAVEAAERTQVVFTTHSAAFLDALTPFNPTVTVVEARGSETQIKNISTEILSHWLKEYTLGEIFRSRQLETMA
jgi:predicted ATPase